MALGEPSYNLDNLELKTSVHNPDKVPRDRPESACTLQGCFDFGDAPSCLTTVSLAAPYSTRKYMYPADVEHAVGDQGKQLHAAAAPVLQYEGFEQSPYEKDDARTDADSQLVRRDIQTCGTVYDLDSRSKPSQ